MDILNDPSQNYNNPHETKEKPTQKLFNALEVVTHSYNKCGKRG